MHLHGFLLIINLAITVVFSDNREVSVRYNVDNIKRNINTNDVNKISKLRLILLSDLKKPNEISVSAKMCFFLKYFFGVCGFTWFDCLLLCQRQYQLLRKTT